MALHARCEPLSRSEHLASQLDLALVDVAAKEGQLGLVRALGDLDEPRPWGAVRAVAPAITALLEDVLQVEGRVLGPDPHGPAGGACEEYGQGGRWGCRQGTRENFEEGKAGWVTIDRYPENRAGAPASDRRPRMSCITHAIHWARSAGLKPSGATLIRESSPPLR